jgi:hypothetical protein
MLGLMLAVALGMDPFEGLPNVELEVPVAGQLESLNTPVQARAYRVKMKPADVLLWVDASFRRHKLYIPPPEKRSQLTGAPQLTGYDHPTRQSYTAIFKDNGDGTTTLIAGHADLSKGGWTKAGETMPAMPGAQDVAEASSEGALTMTYLVKASAEEVEAFYAEVFKKNGFTRDEKLEGWVKAGQLVRLQHGPRGKEHRSVALTARPVATR